MKAGLDITVMLGGPSAEREVSLRSGAAVAEALRARGHRVTELDPRTPGWSLAGDTDAVFLALHGSYGEDGTVQAELDRSGVPYTGCGTEASRLAFDKVASKERFLECGVPTAPFLVATIDARPALDGSFAPPVVLKPALQGSSVGLQFVERAEDLDRCLAEALKHGDTILVEPKIVGREVTVALLGGDVLPVVEIRPRSGGYDYHNKYTVGATEYFCPADLGDELTARVQKAAMAAFRAVGGRDYGRVDLMVPGDGRPLVLEVNTLPGMTETSLLPKAAAAAGIEYGELCERMVTLALERAAVTV